MNRSTASVGIPVAAAALALTAVTATFGCATLGEHGTAGRHGTSTRPSPTLPDAARLQAHVRSGEASRAAVPDCPLGFTYPDREC
jgi:hypothetical protein